MTTSRLAGAGGSMSTAAQSRSPRRGGCAAPHLGGRRAGLRLEGAARGWTVEAHPAVLALEHQAQAEAADHRRVAVVAAGAGGVLHRVLTGDVAERQLDGLVL